MLFLDAYSSQYLNSSSSPYLSQLAQEADYALLEPMFSFQGIGASMFTGTSMNTHKIWCDWVLRKEKTKIPNLLKYSLLLSEIIPNDRIVKDIRWVLYKLLKIELGTPSFIPVTILPFFELKFSKKFTDSNPIDNITTLFDQLKKFNMSFYISGLYDNVSEEKIFKRMLVKINDDTTDLLLVKFGLLDELGHKYGPNSDQVHKYLKEIDKKIEAIVKAINATNEKIHLIIFSDHGMAPIHHYVNLEQKLKNLNIKNGVDYLLFLDSTMARFWFFSEKAKKIIHNILETEDCGKILSESELKNLGLDNIGPEYGTSFFALKAGHVFFPDYYRRYNKPKGMHGYFDSPDNPILVVYPKLETITLKEQSVQMLDIMGIILYILAIESPQSCESKFSKRS
jgi:hypothetical protein